MRRTKPVAAPMVARVYLRVSTDAQDLERQEAITTAAKAAGYYVAGIYREKASGARADRPDRGCGVVALQREQLRDPGRCERRRCPYLEHAADPVH